MNTSTCFFCWLGELVILFIITITFFYKACGAVDWQKSSQKPGSTYARLTQRFFPSFPFTVPFYSITLSIKSQENVSYSSKLLFYQSMFRLKQYNKYQGKSQSSKPFLNDFSGIEFRSGILLPFPRNLGEVSMECAVISTNARVVIINCSQSSFTQLFTMRFLQNRAAVVRRELSFMSSTEQKLMPRRSISWHKFELRKKKEVVWWVRWF